MLLVLLASCTATPEIRVLSATLLEQEASVSDGRHRHACANELEGQVRYRKLLPLIASCLASCVASPEIRVVSVRLLETRTSVSDGAGNQVFSTGDLLFTLASDVDLAKSATENRAHLWYLARTCSSNVEMERWPYLYPSTNDQYLVLVNYKSGKSAELTGANQYNLAVLPEDVCFTVGIGSMHPLKNARSKTVRYSLDPALHESLRQYELRGGVHEFQLSPDCRARSCSPWFMQ